MPIIPGNTFPSVNGYGMLLIFSRAPKKNKVDFMNTSVK